MGIWDTLTGKAASDTSNKAAADQYAKEQAAISGLNKYSDTIQGNYAPWTGAGKDALSRLMLGLGIGGGDPSAFTNAYRSLPGYQAGLDTGQKAVMRGANAGNMYQSGATLKALQRYGSDYEDQRVGDYLNRLAGVSDRGLGATNAAVGTEAGLRGQAFGGGLKSAGTIGQGMVAGEQAKQQGLTNLLNAGTYLAGKAIGAFSPMGGGGDGGFSLSSLFGGGSKVGAPTSLAPPPSQVGWNYPYSNWS